MGGGGLGGWRLVGGRWIGKWTGEIAAGSFGAHENIVPRPSGRRLLPPDSAVQTIGFGQLKFGHSLHRTTAVDTQMFV